MSVITLPQAALACSSMIRFELVRSQEVLRTIAGVSQVTSFPDRYWMAQLQVVPQFDADLRAWSLALDQLSDLSNVVAIGPPHYRSPSTGYAGSSPAVNGGTQLGLSLVMDGMANSASVLAAGDYLSFDTTSALGNTNRQLNKVTAALNSNGSGQGTASLLLPIRQAPANDASVNIQTPTAFFMVTTPRSAVEFQIANYSQFTLDLIERVFP